MMRKLATVLAVAVLGAGSLTAHQAQAAPATFSVGVAKRSVDPNACVPIGCRAGGQYLGGFGNGPLVTTVHDPLEVRVMAISNGARMVLLGVVDSQGWFAGNQEGPWGNRDARIDGAAAISTASGIPVASSDIIVSSTHSHAAPTIMGIWGVTDPAYLKYIHDQTVAALVEAATNLQPAILQAGEGDVSASIISAISQTDGYQGWRPDGRLPVLWARDPNTLATIGVYANVPVHADVVNGAGLKLMSSDHIGVERDILDADLGGMSVIAMGTLGRQEATVQTDGLNAATRLGTYVANEIERTLASSAVITDTTVSSAEQYVAVPVTNPLLGGLNYANMAPICPCNAIAAWTIDRSVLPPYALGAALATWFTALRVGDVVYASEPGEAFPEVSTGIRNAMGASKVRVVGMAQDQLGYYFPPESFPFTAVNDSDHHIYNASLLLGDANVQAHAVNAALLGFTPAAVHETNQWDDVDGSQRAGVQFYPVVTESASTSVVFDAYTSGAAIGNGGSNGTISWTFGDGGSTQTTANLGSNSRPTHTYAAPGTYQVVATIDAGGTPVSFTRGVVVDPPVSASVSSNGTTLTASVTGGQGTAIAAHWVFDGGETRDGITVVPPSTSGSVTVIDGAGNRATTTF